MVVPDAVPASGQINATRIWLNPSSAANHLLTTRFAADRAPAYERERLDFGLLAEGPRRVRNCRIFRESRLASIPAQDAA